MSQHQILPVDVVSIAQGLRSLATVIEAFPDDYAGRAYPELPQHVAIHVASTDAVAQWARILAEPVKVSTDDHGYVHTVVVAKFHGVELSIIHLERQPVRELRRPVTVDESLISAVA